MIKTDGITHLHLAVTDMQRSLAFYGNVFGMEELFREGPDLIFLRTPGGNDTLTLNENPSLRAQVGKSGGIQHFGFGIADKSDLDRAVELVEQWGRTSHPAW